MKCLKNCARTLNDVPFLSRSRARGKNVSRERLGATTIARHLERELVELAMGVDVEGVDAHARDEIHLGLFEIASTAVRATASTQNARIVRR